MSLKVYISDRGKCLERGVTRPLTYYLEVSGISLSWNNTHTQANINHNSNIDYIILIVVGAQEWLVLHEDYLDNYAHI